MPLRIATLCGSLQANSANALLLQALAVQWGPRVWVDNCDVAALPLYNRDLDQDEQPAPAPVATLRKQLRSAEVVVVASPEIIHGIPGPLKNALDWCASSGSFVGKSLVLYFVSAGDSEQIAPSLRHTLEVLEAKVVYAKALRNSEVRLALGLSGQAMAPWLQAELEEAFTYMQQPAKAG